jgi:hypothetical protein
MCGMGRRSAKNGDSISVKKRQNDDDATFIAPNAQIRDMRLAT